jgi:opacity protein-like surface antigen
MKKLSILSLSTILFILIFSFQTRAQITAQIGGGIGYSVPTGDYTGSTTDYYAGTKYGMSSGFNLHAKARLGLLFINAFGELDYTSFSSGKGDAEPGQGTVDVSNKIVSIKIGPEFPISIPMSPISPYLQGFVSFNSISGNVEFQGVSNVPSGSYDIASATRVGIGAGAGVTFTVGGLKLDANIQYHLINLTGKEYKIETVTSHERLDNYTSLNDSKDPAYNATVGHFIADDRGISAIEFKLTAMFGL